MTQEVSADDYYTICNPLRYYNETAKNSTPILETQQCQEIIRLQNYKARSTRIAMDIDLSPHSYHMDEPYDRRHQPKCLYEIAMTIRKEDNRSTKASADRFPDHMQSIQGDEDPSPDLLMIKYQSTSKIAIVPRSAELKGRPDDQPGP